MASRAVVLVKPKLCVIDTITIDATLEETHTLTNTVTDHPVEEGSNVSDHVRPDPDTVTLRCFISNTPLSQEQVTRAVQEGAVEFRTTAQQAVQIGAADGRGAQAFAKLLKLRNEGTLVKLATTLRDYALTADQGMVIQSLTIPRTLKDYDGLAFTATFKLIRVVRNRATREVQNKDVRTNRKKKTGAQTPKPADNQDSLEFQLAEGGSNLNKSDHPLLKGLGDLVLRR